MAGATRGAGRGIARALGEAGATVYCTGRSVKGKPSPYGRPETIDETAAMIKAAGGIAIARARRSHERARGHRALPPHPAQPTTASTSSSTAWREKIRC